MTYNGVVITDEMIKWNSSRLQKHQQYVSDMCRKLLRWGPIQERSEYLSIIDTESKTHDHSKEVDPEYTPYILVSWRYKMRDKDPKFDYPQYVQGLLTEATNRHVQVNPHHPEHWSPDKDQALINPNDRDKPTGKIVDATRMATPYIFCMAADWAAMSLEKGNNPFEWFDKNVNIRWLFTPEQASLLRTILEYLWK